MTARLSLRSSLGGLPFLVIAVGMEEITPPVKPALFIWSIYTLTVWATKWGQDCFWSEVTIDLINCLLILPRWQLCAESNGFPASFLYLQQNQSLGSKHRSRNCTLASITSSEVKVMRANENVVEVPPNKNKVWRVWNPFTFTLLTTY